MNRIKKWLLDLAARWHEAVWEHKRKERLRTDQSGQMVVSTANQSIGGLTFGTPQNRAAPFDLQKELARLDAQRDALFARSEYDALEASFKQLFLPDGWGLCLFTDVVHPGHIPLARTVATLLKSGENEPYYLIMFVEGRHAYVGLFQPALNKIFTASVASAVVCGGTKEELLLAMVCMSKDEDKQYA